MSDNPAPRPEATSIDDHRHDRTRRYLDAEFADAELADDDTVRQSIDELLVPVEHWRAHARAAARALDRRVKTGISRDQRTVWACLVPPPTLPPIVTDHPSGLRLFTSPQMADPLECHDDEPDRGA